MDARVARFLWIRPGRQQSKESFTLFGRHTDRATETPVYRPASNPRAAT